MQKATPNTAEQFFALIRNPFKLRLFLLRSLPAAYFAGLRVASASEALCTVSVPYKWFTQNPFRSTYFACLAMAAELSTGVLVMAQVWRRKPKVSMLVTGTEARFYKKATGITLFTCTQGSAIRAAVEKANDTGAAQIVKVYSEGRNKDGEVVAAFWFEWSFKTKSEVRSPQSEDYSP